MGLGWDVRRGREEAWQDKEKKRQESLGFDRGLGYNAGHELSMR
jgi:hypothetical protein